MADGVLLTPQETRSPAASQPFSHFPATRSGKAYRASDGRTWRHRIAAGAPAWCRPGTPVKQLTTLVPESPVLCPWHFCLYPDAKVRPVPPEHVEFIPPEHRQGLA